MRIAAGRTATVRSLLLLAFLAVVSASPPAHGIEVDGRIDAAEWHGARHITDFRLTQPLSRAPAPHRTEAWILATEDGLAVGFRNTQGEGVPRNRQRAQRDEDPPADRVNVNIDFDGDGRTGYNFTVLLSGSIADYTITNENRFNRDWDGEWRHAVTEDGDTWSAEVLIPWHIAPMRSASGDTRRIGVALDRVVSATGERMAWPAISAAEPTYLSVFEKVEVPQFEQSLLVLAPYVVGVYDAVGKRGDFDAGLDVFWKPNGRFQLGGTINPDFGQVESDELVVNFGAIETFYDDKRPFFIENQSFFDVAFGSLNQRNRLLYTRRVGALADNGSGPGDVVAATKLIGSVRDVNYGMFAAVEGGNAGRDFYAARATRDFERYGLGAMIMRVERPFLGRTATVYEMDHRWTPNARWNIRVTAVASQIDEASRSTTDGGAQALIDHDIGSGWRQQLYAVHLGDGLQLNDLGYLERNDFNYLRYQIARRFTDLPEVSPYAAHDLRVAVSRRTNDGGLHIADAWAIGRESERRDGGGQYVEIAGWSRGYDDLITRGHGPVRMPAKLFVSGERWRPRKGRWSFRGHARYAAEGLGGVEQGEVGAYLEPSYHVSDTLRIFAGAEAVHNPDWLLWRGENLLGTYRADMLSLNAGVSWPIRNRHELLVRLEAIGLDAQARQAWRVAADGAPMPSSEELPDFALRNLGFQVRYRWEIAPLSYLYVAYVRGGSLYREGAGLGDAGGEFGRAFDLRDSEQFLLKLSYRFDW